MRCYGISQPMTEANGIRKWDVMEFHIASFLSEPVMAAAQRGLTFENSRLKKLSNGWLTVSASH
jgi:hypothetical protein